MPPTPSSLSVNTALRPDSYARDDSTTPEPYSSATPRSSLIPRKWDITFTSSKPIPLPTMLKGAGGPNMFEGAATFESGKVRSFAVYDSEDLTQLLTFQDAWSPVDMLVVKFAALKSLTLTVGGRSDSFSSVNGPPQFNSRSGSFGAMDRPRTGSLLAGERPSPGRSGSFGAQGPYSPYSSSPSTLVAGSYGSQVSFAHQPTTPNSFRRFDLTSTPPVPSSLSHPDLPSAIDHHDPRSSTTSIPTPTQPPNKPRSGSMSWFFRHTRSPSMSSTDTSSPPPQTPRPSIGSNPLRNLLDRRVPYIILELNLADLYRRYEEKAHIGSSFTAYVLDYISSNLRSVPVHAMPKLTGFLLTGLKDLAKLRDRPDAGVAKVIDAIKGLTTSESTTGEAAPSGTRSEYAQSMISLATVHTDASWCSPIVILDSYGADLWDSVRDKMNGVMLENPFFKGNGKQKIRFGVDRTDFDALCKKLSVEISLRDDFVVLDREVSVKQELLDAAIIRTYVRWFRGLSFVGFYTQDHPLFNPMANTSTGSVHSIHSIQAMSVVPPAVESVKPVGFNDLGDDSIFEMATHPVILKVKEDVQSLVGAIVDQDEKKVVDKRRSYPLEAETVTPEIWADVLDPRTTKIPGKLLKTLGDPMTMPVIEIGKGAPAQVMLRKPREPVPFATTAIYKGIEHLQKLYPRSKSTSQPTNPYRNPGLPTQSQYSIDSSMPMPLTSIMKNPSLGVSTNALSRDSMSFDQRSMGTQLNLKRQKSMGGQSQVSSTTTTQIAETKPKRMSKRISYLSDLQPPTISSNHQNGNLQLTNGNRPRGNSSASQFRNLYSGSHILLASVTHFTADYGPQRRDEIAHMILNVMFDLLDKKLLAEADRNVDVEGASSEIMGGIVETLEEILTSPSECVKWLLTQSRNRNQDPSNTTLTDPVPESDDPMLSLTVELIRSLLHGLKNGDIKVHIPMKAAFLANLKTGVAYTPVWAVVGERNATTHIFLSEECGVQERVEVILHAWCAAQEGWSSVRCIVAESLIQAQRCGEVEVGKMPLPVPKRLQYEIDALAPSELLATIRNCDGKQKSIWGNPVLGEGEATFVVGVCDYLSRRAEWILTEKEGWIDAMKQAADDGYEPRNQVEIRMTSWVGRCTLGPKGADDLLEVSKGIWADIEHHLGEDYDLGKLTLTEGRRRRLWALCYLFSIFWKSCRRTAYTELMSSLITKNPSFLPDADQAAVCIEMTTTATILQSIFSLSSHTLSRSLHSLLRKRTAEERYAARRVEKKGAEEMKEEGVEEGTQALKRSVVNAYIFVYPILLDIAMVLALGSGIFSSNRMDAKGLEASSVVFLGMFPVIGAVMNSIGRTVTYYFYQKSIPLMIAAFYRRLAGAIILFLICGLIMGGAAWYMVGTWYHGLLAMIYAIMFGLFMVFFCVLIILRDPDEYFFKSAGPAAVLRMLIILLPNAFICRFYFSDSSYPLVVWGIYILSLTLATSYMFYSFVWITQTYIKWPEVVKPTPRKDILEMYARVMPKSTAEEEPDADKLGKKTRRWERSATEWYAAKMQHALEQHLTKPGAEHQDPAIKARMKQWFWENMLMKWYAQRAGMTNLKKFSSEWDGVVKQAVAELKKKYTVEKLNRGDILFDNELPAIAFGFLYFVMIFGDRWTVLFVTGRAVTFFPSSEVGQDYLYGALGGLLYLLLASGLLELTLSSFYANHKAIAMTSLADTEGPQTIFEQYRLALKVLYEREIKKFFLLSTPILIIACAVIIPLSVLNKRWTMLITFGITIFGYIGLLIGLFHKLFIAQKETTVNTGLGGALALSLVASSVVVRLIGEPQWACISTALCGWGFAAVCIGSSYFEKVQSVHYTISISPNLTSSGQRNIGQPHSDTIAHARTQLGKNLLDSLHHTERIKSQSALGMGVKAYLQNTSETLASLAPTHIFRVAFASAPTQLMNLVRAFMENHLLVHRAEDPLEAGGATYAAIAMADDREASARRLHVFLSPIDMALNQFQTLLVTVEAVVHEFVEVTGTLHSGACIAETLLAVSGPDGGVVREGADDWAERLLPERMKIQIEGMNEAEKAKVWYRTQEVVGRKACLGVDVDTKWHWEGGMTGEDRAFMVALAKIWWDCFEEMELTARYPRAMTALLSKAPASFRKLLTQPGLPLDIDSHAAQSLLSCALAFNIEHLCKQAVRKPGKYNDGTSSRRTKRGFGSTLTRKLTLGKGNFTLSRGFTLSRTMSRNKAAARPRLPADPKDHKDSMWDTLWERFLETRVVFFLALTADQRFGREVSSQYLLRLPLVVVHAVCRALLNSLQDTFLYRQNPNINLLLKQAKQGLCRVHHYERQGGKTEVSLIETYISASHTMVAVIERSEGDEEMGKKHDLIVANRYKIAGSKPEGWKAGTAKPASIGHYEKLGGGKYRLLHELVHDAGGKVVGTHIYEYTLNGNGKTTIPRRRYVFNEAVDPATWKFGQPGHPEPAEIQTFSLLADNAVVTEVVMLRKHKPSGVKATVHAAYEYPRKGAQAGPRRAIFRSNYPSQWQMTVEYARLTRTEGKPRLASVELIQMQGVSDIRYFTAFDYTHPEHVRLDTVRFFIDPSQADVRVRTPNFIENDEFGVLGEQTPSTLYESSDFFVDGLRGIKRRRYGWFGGLQKIEYHDTPYGSLRKRENLWAGWRRGEIAGTFARDLDEIFLRHEPLLGSYWRRRDVGDVEGARRVLRERKQELNSELQMTDGPWTRTHLQIRYSDLYKLALGGDAQKVYAEGSSLSKSQMNIDEQSGNGTLNVTNVDSGTWPTSGGGVGSCRRDLIAGLDRVRWTAIAEIASAEMVQKDYPVEKHINAIIYLPLWDVDFGTPNENVYRTVPHRVLQMKARRTTAKVVRTMFVPLVQKLIKGCLTDKWDPASVDEYANVFVDFYKFFAVYDWVKAWNHLSTQEAWIRGWLDIAWRQWKKDKLVDIETPTLRHVEMLYDLLARLLLPLTVTIPQDPVIHCSHHGVQAIVGVVAKALHGSSVVVWDHGILWRERLFGLCFDDNMPRFVHIGFAGLTRLVAKVVYARADYVTPCTSVQNVAWEAWLGGGKHGNALENVQMHRKINPVLNGMDVMKFQPNPSLEHDVPMGVMLSHISPVKDVMNAIAAARFIVHEFKLSNYQLHIYGSPDKDPSYTAECQRAIANFGLANNVFMKGLGSPSKVLPTGWVFVNSSITEGLPLALGEAGLCGLPVVCTDVGGSREVIRNDRTGETCGAIVPPSKPRQLALAQLKVLAVSDGVGKWVGVGEPGGVPEVSVEELLAKPGKLAERINDQAVKEARRKVGMRLRERTISVFSIARYWREHEQICWLGPSYAKKRR
ncbi:hypothetical protein HDV00_012764 [Rhizophlyctis rosea]|nr:hypothetical protein HDV00_012764 [Rhizophlyctis rosea]